MSHIGMSQVAHMSESHRAHKWVGSFKGRRFESSHVGLMLFFCFFRAHHRAPLTIHDCNFYSNARFRRTWTNIQFLTYYSALVQTNVSLLQSFRDQLWAITCRFLFHWWFSEKMSLNMVIGMEFRIVNAPQVSFQTAPFKRDMNFDISDSDFYSDDTATCTKALYE